jgi:hypothetical protein
MPRTTRFAIIDKLKNPPAVTHIKNLTYGTPGTWRFPPERYEIREVPDEVQSGWVVENGKLLPPLRDRDPEPRLKKNAA